MMPDVIGTCYGKVEEFMEITPALWSIRESPMLPRRWESCGLCPCFSGKMGRDSGELCGLMKIRQG